MKSKHLLITLLLALMVPWAAMAQATHTVYDGNDESQLIPLYAYSGDTEGTTSEFIIPADDLSALTGKTISKLTFYLSQQGSKTWTATYQVYLKEVEATTLNSNYGPDACTVVYTGTVNGQVDEMTIVFNDNYTYNGGNLLIGTYVSTEGAWDSNGKFYGTEVEGAAYLSGDWGGYSTGGYDFIPKTTFTYLTSDPYITLDPTSTTVITGFTQTLTATVGNVSGTPTITYESNDTHVATVDGSGTTATVTGVAPGTATITATMNYQGTDYTATCAVTVEDPSYCEPYFSSPSDDYISNFTTTGGVTNINNSSTYETGGYSDYFDTKSASIETGETLSCTVTPSSTQWSYGHAIWVDWNKDYEFSSDEMAAYTTSSASGNWTGEVEIPVTTTPGDYRMRVIHLYNSTPTDACMSGQYGEGEDYKLTVLAANPYQKPQSLTVSDLTNISATISWTAPNENVTGYKYQYKPEGGEWSALTSTTALSAPLTGLTSNTNYTFQVKAIYSGGESDFASKDFTTLYCNPADMCELSYELTTTSGYTSYGWYGSYIKVMDANTNEVLTTWTEDSGTGTTAGTFAVCEGRELHFEWYSANANNDQILIASYAIYDANGEEITSGTGPMTTSVNYTMSCTPPTCPKPTNLTNGTPTAHEVLLSWTENGSAERWQICVNGDEGNLLLVNENPYTLGSLIGETDYTVKVRAFCDETDQSLWSNTVSFTTDEACSKPTNLKEENITINSATLSWTGTNDSYVLQYRPWYPAGDDITATGTMTPYVVDLSAYTGIGAVAIRHYDVSDMFQLIVDDIVVTNAANEVVFSENFESCDGNMPAAFTNMDLDGDGYEWEIASSPSSNVNGSYGIVSASYDNDAGALFPDNWLIISGLEMGGQMTFYARGQDPNWAAENFAIYVSTESSIVEVPLTATSYLAENLTPNTPYAWQVKGITGVEESIYVSSFFKTLDDLLVFATDGDWDVLANWTDVEGNSVAALPTKEYNVRIDADATIPAGVVAEVNKANINGGSITIEEGGQLKHASASLSVTLNKGITGYSAEKDHYYFISTPFSGVTLVGSTTWSHINNITDNEYDLYGFDATNVGEEWINWKSSPGSFDVFVSGNNTGLKPTYGYLYANSEDVDLEFVGTAGPTNTNPVYSVTYDMTSTDPWNGFVLVGNPFTCNAYVTFAPASGTPSEIDFYVMNDEGDGYTLSATNVTLAPMQGAFFWSDIDGDVTFSSEAPAGGKSALLNMSLSQNRGSVDQARVRFGQGYNLKHMSFRNNSSSIYMPVDGNDYAVVNTNENAGEMPVSFKAEKNGTYTLSFTSENVEFGYLHLIDNLTGNDVDLLATPSYSFEARTTDYASRFTLVFATGNAEDNFAFFSNGSFVINNEGNATLQVVDVMGRIISSEAINGCTNLNMNAAPGVYMLRLVNGNDVKVQKVVVR